MYIPRLRRMTDAIAHLKSIDPQTELTPHFLETLIYTEKITALKYGYAWVVNLDELYAFFSTEPTEQPPLVFDLPQKMMTSTQIVKLFMEEDGDTLIRRPNLRRFIQANNLPYYPYNPSKWIIDSEKFMQAVNPRGICQRAAPPKIRSLLRSIDLLKAEHPHLQLTRQEILSTFESDEVFKIKNGTHWLLNYDELETAILLENYIIKK